jgi:predicted ArsR family transcriptional regulator
VTTAGLTTAQARALGAPTRQAIVAYLGDAARPVSVAELTTHLGLNHNAVRKHLAQLVAAGLITEQREARTTPGRPRLVYRLRADAAAGADQPYRRLAVLLATTLATGDEPVAVGRRAAVARPVGPGADPIDALAAQLAADGFDPEVRRGRQTEVALQRCPYADAAAANPFAVCQLHLGMAQATAAAVGGVTVDDLVPKDPYRAGCLLHVRAAAS